MTAFQDKNDVLIHSEEDDFRWLVGSEARAYLQHAAGDEGNLVARAKTLRKNLSPVRAHLVLEQCDLRRRARGKFSRAEEMFFTRQLLEQATEERIAIYKASRVSPQQCVLDLCCGLGGDLIGWSARGACRGVDRDPLAALLACVNCAAYSIPSIHTLVADVTAIDLVDCDVWHIDPDRRPTGQRTTQLAYCEPGVEVIEKLLKQQPNGAVKLAPATEVPVHWDEGAQREWIGSRRECRQQVVWFGNLALQPGTCRATVVMRDGHHPSLVGPGDTPITTTEKFGRFVMEPHAAVLAARLTGMLCAQHSLHAVDGCTGYLTADLPLTGPLLAAFEVLEILPFDLKQLRAAMRQRRIGRLEIKVRGADVHPARLRAQLKLRGDNQQTLLIVGSPRRVRAVLARRVDQESVSGEW